MQENKTIGKEEKKRKEEFPLDDVANWNTAINLIQFQMKEENVLQSLRSRENESYLFPRAGNQSAE